MMVDPKEIVEEWDIRPGMRVADFGCGSGHYSIEAAKKVGAEGRVYAFDVQEEALSGLKSRMSGEHLYNIEYRRADLEQPRGTGLADSILDTVIVSNILFQAEDKTALASEAFRILRTNGRVILTDWDESLTSLGPPSGQRVTRQAAQDIFAKAGFVFEKEVEAESSHYCLIFRKK